MGKSKTALSRERKLNRRSRRHYVVSVILLTAVLLVGGSFLALLVHLQRSGELGAIFEVIRSLFVPGTIVGTLIIFWVLVVPFLLLILLIVNIVRRRKFKYYRRTWEETVKIAVEAERQAYAAEEEKRRHVKRFSRLYEIVPPEKPAVSRKPTLEEMCREFRAFAAARLHLYYTEAQIREFVASLAVSRILILQGMSGTGKTSLTYAFGEFIGNPASIIPVQPMWKERSDLLGYYNEFTKKYNETELLRKMYEANGREEMYIAVLDEMNIARVEYYFAEFLSLLEIPNPDLRYLEVVSDSWEDDPAGLKEGRIKLPENMWFVGTANNDDSTFSISDKVYDRAMIVNLTTRTVPFEASSAGPMPVTYPVFTALIEDAQRSYEMTKRNEQRLKTLDDYLISTFQITFGNRIMRQIKSYLAVYVRCGGDELDALDDILAKKVLRKLAYKDLSQYRTELAAAGRFVEELFGENRMPQCRAVFANISKS